MDELDRDIQQARWLAQRAYDQGHVAAWLMASCVLLSWRIARAVRWVK